MRTFILFSLAVYDCLSYFLFGGKKLTPKEF